MIKLSKILIEAKIEYTPEYIDNFITQAEDFIKKTKLLRESYIFEIAELNVNDILNDLGGKRSTLNRLKKFEETIQSVHNKLSTVVNAYDFLEAPDNVKQLEKLTDQVDNIYFETGKLVDAYESLIEAAEKMKEFI
jgi:hypothetical protein